MVNLPRSWEFFSTGSFLATGPGGIGEKGCHADTLVDRKEGSLLPLPLEDRCAHRTRLGAHTRAVITGLLCCPTAFALIVPAAAAIVPAITQGKANLLGSMYRLLT